MYDSRDFIADFNLTHRKLGYYDCPNHGVVDYEPCPICDLDKPHRIRQPIEEGPYVPILSPAPRCTICQGLIGDHYLFRHNGENPYQLFCITCAEKYELEYTWEEMPEPISVTREEFMIEKALALREHGCIQESGINPDVAMDGLASFIRRRVLPDIKTKKLKGRLD